MRNATPVICCCRVKFIRVIQSICHSRLILILLLPLIAAEEEWQRTFNQSTEFEMSCVVNNVTYTGEECLESLSKFGRIVGYILLSVVLIVIGCCCCFWCCICKIFHSNKSRIGRSQRGPPAQAPVIATVT